MHLSMYLIIKVLQYLPDWNGYLNNLQGMETVMMIEFQGIGRKGRNHQWALQDW